MLEAAVWVIKLLAIAVVGVVCWSLAFGVGNRMVSKMIVVVCVIVAVSLTLELVTPKFLKTQQYVQKQTETIDRTRSTLEEINRYSQKISPSQPIETKPRSKTWWEFFLFGD